MWNKHFRFLSAALVGVLAVGFGCEEPTPEPDACDFLPEDNERCEGLGDERPEKRSEMMGIYDEERDRVVVFSGSSAVPEQCGFPVPTFLEETWAFDVACGKWTDITADGPRGRVRHMFTYDGANDRAILFGGRFRLGGIGNFTNMNDVWALNLADDTWEQLVPNIDEPGAPAVSPTPRVVGAWVVNDAGTKAYLFGGNISLNNLSYNPLGDLWELDLDTLAWTELQPVGGPPADRLFAASLWDPERDRFVIMGGADEGAFDNNAVYFNDVWAYDPATNAWTEMHDGTGIGGETVPAGRFWGEWVYDETNDKYRLFGGHDDQRLGNANDQWLFDPSNATWELVRIGDTFNRESNGFCDFPPDFTLVQVDVPERRNSHALVYSTYEQCPGMISAFGKTDCGVTDDVHRFRLDRGEWQQLQVAREGEACRRRGREAAIVDMLNDEDDVDAAFIADILDDDAATALLAARPFDSIEDVDKVEGISADALKSLGDKALEEEYGAFACNDLCF